MFGQMDRPAGSLKRKSLADAETGTETWDEQKYNGEIYYTFIAY